MSNYKKVWAVGDNFHYGHVEGFVYKVEHSCKENWPYESEAPLLVYRHPEAAEHARTASLAAPTAGKVFEAAIVPYAEVEAYKVQEVAAEARIKHLQDKLDEAERKHQADIDAISKRFWQEAEDRDWCDVAKEVIKSLNADLYRLLDIPKQEYVVYMDVTVPVSWTVSASSAEEAQAMADTSMARAALNDCGGYFDTIADYDITDVEVA